MATPNNLSNPKTADLTELVGTQLFKQVSMAQVAALLRFCPTLTLMNGDKLIVPGQTVDKVHLLLQGRLQVFEDRPNEKPIGQIQQGECVGLSSFVDRQPCHVSIISEGICRLLVLDEERLTALINTPTTVSRNMLFMLMHYLHQKAARATAPVATTPTPNNHIDAITGLHNQRWLDETLDRLILRAATERAPLSLVAVDLFDAPALNMEYGQEMLDMSLCEIAKTLSHSLRPTDLIARHATGPFVIMLPDTNEEDAALVSERIQEIVNRTEIVIPGVCVLPPMKVVMGAVTMSAFVSGRKLVGDAFSALERRRASVPAATIETPPEIPVEPEALAGATAEIIAVEAEHPETAGAVDTQALHNESAPATQEPSGIELATDTQLENNFSTSEITESESILQPENEILETGPANGNAPG